MFLSFVTGSNHTGVAVAFALLVILVLVLGLVWFICKKKRLHWSAFSSVHYQRGLNDDEADDVFTKDGYWGKTVPSGRFSTNFTVWSRKDCTTWCVVTSFWKSDKVINGGWVSFLSTSVQFLFKPTVIICIWPQLLKVQGFWSCVTYFDLEYYFPSPYWKMSLIK